MFTYLIDACQGFLQQQHGDISVHVAEKLSSLLSSLCEYDEQLKLRRRLEARPSVEAFSWDAVGPKLFVNIGDSQGRISVVVEQHINRAQCIVQDLPNFLLKVLPSYQQRWSTKPDSWHMVPPPSSPSKSRGILLPVVFS